LVLVLVFLAKQPRLAVAAQEEGEKPKQLE